MTTLSSDRLHASCVAIGGRAVLIEGLSGSGKSDLTLRLIDRGAMLVSDDYTFIRRDGTRLLASAPPALAGKIEVRGLGILEFPHVDDVPVALMVSVGEPVERLPEDGRAQNLIGISIPHIALAALETSAPIKLEHALRLRGLAFK
jgi:serine kinase of HPr protein (carbohydrate metabolism regulator)